MATSITSVMEQMRKMHSLELYSSLSLFTNLTTTMAKNCNDLFTVAQQCEMHKYQADCLFEKKEYKSSLLLYDKALQLYKSVPKAKSKQSLLNLQQVTSDVDIRFNIYQCFIALKNDNDALRILEGINHKLRTPKINLALAKQYQKLDVEKAAVACYKEVLKACPLAVDCAIELLRLGEHPNVVISIINTHCHLDWLVPYIKAHSIRLGKDVNKTVVAFEGLCKRVSLNANPSLLCDLATAQCHAGDKLAAIQYFKTAHLQDPLWLRGMDLYAYLLCDDEQNDELERLSSKLFAVSELHPEPWVAIGYHSKLKGHYKEAVCLAVRALELDGTCAQALLLKGSSLCMLNDVKAAITHFRQAMLLAPTNLNCYSELVACYLHEKRNNEALNIAKSALDSVGYSPDALVLCSTVLIAEPPSFEQASRMIDRALSMCPNHKSALRNRCIVAIRQDRYQDAIKVLKSAVQTHGGSTFHSMLARCYLKTQKYADAIDHYNISLSLNPNDNTAKDGLAKIHAIEHGEPFETDDVGSITGNDESSINEWNYVS